MFCKKCGAPMDADAAFCVYCGTPVAVSPTAAPENSEAAPMQQYPPVYTPAPSQQPPYQQAPVYNPAYTPVPAYAPAKAPMDPAKKKKLMLFGGIGAAVILAVVLLIVFLGNSVGFSSPEAAAKAVVTATATRDVKAVLNCVPDFMVRELAVESGLGIDASRSAIAKVANALMPKEESDEIKILSAEVTDSIDPDDYYRLHNSYYEYLYDEEREEITDVVLVEVSFLYDGDETSTEVICIKMDGVWYVIDMD